MMSGPAIGSDAAADVCRVQSQRSGSPSDAVPDQTGRHNHQLHDFATDDPFNKTSRETDRHPAVFLFCCSFTAPNQSTYDESSD
jgi:hypothetical protein